MTGHQTRHAPPRPVFDVVKIVARIKAGLRIGQQVDARPAIGRGCG